MYPFKQDPDTKLASENHQSWAGTNRSSPKVRVYSGVLWSLVGVYYVKNQGLIFCI